MKKIIILLLAAVLIFTCSCSKTKPSPDATGTTDRNDPQQTAAVLPSTEPQTEPEPERLHISELISEDGVMTDEWGDDCEYSYHVPQLDADTTDAEYINECIQSGYTEPVASCKESIAQSIMPDICSISWGSYQNGSVVSLVVKTITYYSYYESYDVFNYDVESGKQLLTKDMLKLKSITDDTYWEAVRCAAVQYFDEAFFETFTKWGSEYQSDYSERRSWTCSDQNLLNNTMPYLNENGELAVIAAVGSLAGGSSYYHVLTPDFTPDTSAALQDEYADAFYATLQDGRLQIGFSTGAGTLLAANGYEGDISYSETYPVHGLYSDYTALCCSVIGGQPVVFLLTDTGAVEFVDITLGLKSGYFCSGGLIMGVEDITGFEKGTTVQSVAASGAKTDLAPLVDAYKRSIPMSLPGYWNIDIAELTEAGESDTVTYMITLSSDNQATMQTIGKQTGEAYTYEGYFMPFGMSEGGYVFYYCFTNAFGSTVFEGAAALYNAYSEGDNGYCNYLYWREMGTTGAFSALYEGEAILAESVG